jgi:hypothetical protein
MGYLQVEDCPQCGEADRDCHCDELISVIHFRQSPIVINNNTREINMALRDTRICHGCFQQAHFCVCQSSASKEVKVDTVGAIDDCPMTYFMGSDRGREAMAEALWKNFCDQFFTIGGGKDELLKGIQSSLAQAFAQGRANPKYLELNTAKGHWEVWHGGKIISTHASMDAARAVHPDLEV